MMNWCENNIVIVANKKKLQQVKSALQGRDVAFECVGEDGGVAFDKETLFCFHKLVPVPGLVARGQYDPVGYKWCRQNWGTKWQAG